MAPNTQHQTKETPTRETPIPELTIMQATTNEPATTEGSKPNATNDPKMVSVMSSEAPEQLDEDPYPELDNNQALEAKLQCKQKLLHQLERKLELQEIQHQIERLQCKTTQPFSNPATTTATSTKLDIEDTPQPDSLSSTGNPSVENISQCATPLHLRPVPSLGDLSSSQQPGDSSQMISVAHNSLVTAHTPPSTLCTMCVTTFLLSQACKGHHLPILS